MFKKHINYKKKEGRKTSMNPSILPKIRDFLNNKQSKTLPIYCKIPQDTYTPIGIFEKLKKLSPTFLLESLGPHDMNTRYSYIGLDTKEVTFFYPNLESLETDSSNATAYLKDLPPFYNGYMGYLSFENVQEYFHIKGHSLEQNLQILKCKTMIIIDHNSKTLFVVYNAQTTLDAYKQGIKRIKDILFSLNQPLDVTDTLIPGFCKLQSNMTKSEFLNKVEIIKSYIKAGEVFQVVLSQCFSGHVPNIDAFLLYKNVRILNPSSFLSYIKFEDRYVICSSPEMLINCQNGRVQSAPIAGTRPIKNDGKDKLRASNLINDPKELAEHTMLVDLGRNDLNKVSRPGSVTVKSFCKLKKYAQVMHLVSELEGELSKKYTSIKAMISAFPAGTVSGAPKKRALQIIHELEPTPRDIYAGTIFYLSMDGSLKSCIAIRTIQIKDDQLSLQAGAGIVHDSIPEAEYKETLNKAKALFDAMENIYEGGIIYDFSY